jgi:transposase-like protein
MAQYSPEFLASLQHRYEKTDQPMIEIAREFGIGITTLQVLVDKHAFEKRSQRLRGMPRAARLEREAEALAADVPSPEKEPPTPDPSPPLAALAGGGEQTPVERLEQLVVQEIADLESARDLRGGKRLSGAGAERTAQALASLTRTLQTVRAMRGEAVAHADEVVEDIDAFRLRLAKKIDDFFERRKDDDFGAGIEDAGAVAEGEPRNRLKL